MTRNIADWLIYAMGQLNFWRLVAILFGAVTAVLLIVEACLGYEAAFVFNRGAAADLLAIAAVTLAVFKVFWLTFAIAFFARKEKIAGGGAIIIGLLCHIYSLQSGVGLAAEGRALITASREGQIQDRGRVQENYDMAKQRSTALSGQRPSLRVQEDIASTELALKDAQTQQASAATRQAAEKATGLGKNYNAAVDDEKAAAKKVEEARVKIDALKSELTLSREAEAMRTRVQELADKLSGMTAVPAHADPQAHVLASYLNAMGIGATANGASLAMPLWLPLFVEFAGVLGLMFAATAWQLGSPPKVERQEAAPQVVMATRVIEAQPQPVAMPPEPLKPEEQALRDLRELIAHGNSLGRKIPAAGRPLVEHFNGALNRAYSHSTFAGWAKKWVEDGKIGKVTEGKKVFYVLPPQGRYASRQLRAA